MSICVSHPRNYELLEGRGGIIFTYYQTGAFGVGGWIRGLVKSEGERKVAAGWTDGWMRGCIMLRNMGYRVRLNSGADAIT